MTKIYKHLPVLGIGVFVIMYIYSASLYPGGSVIDDKTVGYDWFHNYWCDLMYTQSLNGEQNKAKPYAVFGWAVLCISILSILLLLIPKLYRQPKIKIALQLGAILAMGFGLMASTENHDLYVALSFPFGAAIVLTLTFAAQRQRPDFLSYTAWLVVVLLTSSFIMYFTSYGLFWIGFIQKVALAVSFIWIIVYHYQYIGKQKA